MSSWAGAAIREYLSDAEWAYGVERRISCPAVQGGLFRSSHAVVESDDNSASRRDAFTEMGLKRPPGQIDREADLVEPAIPSPGSLTA